MKKNFYLLTFLFISTLLIPKCNSTSSELSEIASIKMFDEILFYDGYAETVNEPVPDGVIRLRNSRYIKQIPESFIENLNPKLDMEIIVKAGCDNYDRIGGVFLSLINKGEPYSESGIVNQVEVARFITPFMDKNESPQEVPYFFEIDNIAKLLSDSDFSSQYDFWLEFDIFGVPYAANREIAGCDGQCYTFYGTINLTSNVDSEEIKEQCFLPIVSYEYLNNYSHTDQTGQTVRSFSVATETLIKNAKLYLITSNHGANSGGEEYNRRDHYVYFDDILVGVYKPGGKSCEPYRVYNTQSNGIYGRSARTESEWSSFSNWCPGDIIPIRVFELGDLGPGTHVFKIEVPDARFVNGQGEIPVSAYIQGDKD